MSAPPIQGRSSGGIGRLLRPLERAIRLEAAGGVALVLSALIALAWANSPWQASYEQLWQNRLVIAIPPFASRETLRFWVNEGLMTFFFLLVGRELRYELREGAFADVRRALLPVVAAVAGMAIPAFIFLLLNPASPASRGWGVPTATDIALSTGILVLLGSRVPRQLRVFLLALAATDDIGSIALVAAAYHGSFSAAAALGLLGALAGLALLQRLKIRSPPAYLVLGVAAWLCALHAHLSPALVGLPLGLFAPLGRVDRLHPWVVFGIVPLFALANAGVGVGGLSWERTGAGVAAGVFLARVLGKPLGIFAASFGMVRSGLSRLPDGVTWRGIWIVGCLGGIGLTVPLYVTHAAFGDGPLAQVAKLGLLAASIVSSLAGLLLGRLLLEG